MTSAERKQLIQGISDNTLKSRLGDWARNVVANEHKIKAGKGIVKLFDKTKDLPAIIVASGPSLDKNVALLKEVKNKALIIAVDSSLQAILEVGVRPDVLFVADSKDRVKGFFENVDSLDGMFVILDSFVSPKVVEKIEELGGWIYWYNVFPSSKSLFCQIVPDQFTGPIGLLGSGGCVSSIAFAFATGALKADPVIIIGQDSGYYTPDKHHAKAIIKNAERFPFQETIEEDIYEKPIITNATLRTYAYWLEDIVIGNQTNGMFINATEGGIVKRGWCIMPLRIVIDRYLKKEYNFKELLLGENKKNENSRVDPIKKEQKDKKQEPETGARKSYAEFSNKDGKKKFVAK